MTDRPFEYDRHDDNDKPYPIEYDQNFFLWVSICLSVSMNMLVRSALDRAPAPARKLALARTPAQASLPRRFAPLQEKKYLARRLGGPRTR